MSALKKPAVRILLLIRGNRHYPVFCAECGRHVDLRVERAFSDPARLIPTAYCETCADAILAGNPEADDEKPR